MEAPARSRRAHRFDVAALERYLAAHLPGFRGPIQVEQFKGGQSNPTFKLPHRRRPTFCAASLPASFCRPRTRSIASIA